MPETVITETPESPPETTPAKSSFFDILEKELPGAPETATPEKVEPAKEKVGEAKPAEAEPAKSDGRAPSELFKKSEEKAEPPASEIDKIANAIKTKSEQEAVNLGTLRTKAKEFEEKARSLETKIAEAELKGKNTDVLEARLKELETRNTELDSVVARANAESRPEFRQKYVDGRAKIVSEIEQMITNAGGEAKNVSSALALRGKQREDAMNEAVDGMPPYRAMRIAEKIEKLDELDAEADHIRDNARDYWKDVQKREQEAAQQEEVAFRKSAFESYDRARRALESELEVLRPIKKDGMEWWNDQAKGILDRSGKKYKEEWTMETAAKAAIWDEAGPVYRELFQKEREYSEAEIPKRDARIAELEAELKGIYNKSPQILAARGDANAGKKKGFFDILNENLPGGD